MSHLPRNGQYELFLYRERVYCFDDPSLESVPVSDSMISWLDKQNRRLCRPYKVDPQHKPSCYYLQPELYLMWKLKWQS